MSKVDEPETMESSTLCYLALGDSYTIGESVSVNERFPVQLVSELRKMGLSLKDPVIIATTGWTTLDLVRAIEQAPLEGESYDLVSLLIGVNDQYQGIDFALYEPDFRKLLTHAIALAGGDRSRVFVVSIPDYAFTPFGQSSAPEVISKELADYNVVNRRVSMELGIDYIDITPISQMGLQQPELIASDGLHPSGAMYGRWVELIMEEKLKDLR